MVEERFLIDANTLITPYRLYYAFDLVPTFWNKLSKHTNKIILLDMVKNEIDKGKDDLTDWLNNQTGFEICNHKNPEIISKYGEVIYYIKNSGFYKDSAVYIWAKGNVADPWLIAAAAVNKYTIITLECPSGGLSTVNKNSNVKIPDVAKAFGVKTNNLFYMMRQLEIKI